MAQLDKETVVEGNGIFEEFKGSLTEQYVCQQLVSDCGLVPYYWFMRTSGEIDFLVQRRNSVFAIEVKAEGNLRSKSLRAFKESHPDVEAVLQLSGIPRAGLDEERPAVRDGEYGSCGMRA